MADLPTMQSESFFGQYRNYVIALLPVFGVALTSVHQIGRLSLYGVPYQLMEFSAVDTLTSAIALTVTSAAALLSLTIAYSRDLQTHWHRATQHVVLASMLTGPFWIESVQIGASPSWPTIIFITVLAGVGYITEGYYRMLRTGGDKSEDPQKRVERALRVVVLLGMVSLAGSFVHGYQFTMSQPSRLFIHGTNDLFVSSFNGWLVIKEYDPKTGKINKGTTVMMEPPARLVIVERPAPILE